MQPRRKRTDARRSISVKGLTYQWVKDYCEKEERSISGLLEDLIAKHLEEVAFPKPDEVRDAPRAKSKNYENERPAGNYFTF